MGVNESYLFRSIKTILIEASLHQGTDFEESVLYTSALFSGMEYIVTRDANGFQNAKVKILSPAELVAKMVAHLP